MSLVNFTKEIKSLNLYQQCVWKVLDLNIYNITQLVLLKSYITYKNTTKVTSNFGFIAVAVFASNLKINDYTSNELLKGGEVLFAKDDLKHCI